MNDQVVSYAIIGKVPKCWIKEKSWCGKAATKFVVDKFLYRVPDKSVIVNFDNAPGHNCPTIDAQIKASGRIILRTPAKLSMHLQSNDSYINSHIQYAKDSILPGNNPNAVE